MLVFALSCLVVWCFNFQKLAICFGLFFFVNILGVSDILLLSCSLFVFWFISSISKSENQPFFIIVLTWSASLKTSAFLPDLYHSFSISSLCRIAPKIAVQYKLVVFPSPCFVFASLICVVL